MTVHLSQIGDMPEFKPWFEKYPHWFDDERSKLEAIGFVLEEAILKEHRMVVFRGPCQADSRRKLCIEYPNAFPSAAPKISDFSDTPRLPRHQRFDSAQICLFGFSEHRWSAMLSGADAVAEAEKVIRDVGQLPDPGDTAPEPITRTIPFIERASVLIPFPISVAIDCAVEGVGKAKLKFDFTGQKKTQSFGRGVITSLAWQGKTIDAAVPVSHEFTGTDIAVDVVCISKLPNVQELVTTIDNSIRNARLLKKHDSWIAVVFPDQSGVSKNLRPVWIFCRAALHDSNRRDLIRAFSYEPTQRLARIPRLTGIECKRVMIVGCGSVGSKIAANLAACGVRSFCLVDYDYMEPDNAVRHELGVDSFGLNKAEALVERLETLNPGTSSRSLPLPFHVGTTSKMAREEQFFKEVIASDIVVDATGSHSVSHFLNDLSFELARPVVYASVTNGAWGGDVVSVVPKTTACWLCWNEQYGDTHPATAPRTLGEVFPPGCDQPTFTGTNYEIGFVVNLATDQIVERLLGNCDPLRSYLRWQGRTQDGPKFNTEFLSVNRRPNCYCCGS